MKINMYGGVLTISYNLAKFLREAGEDVTLFVDREPLDKSYAPSWEDEELAKGYPDWIRIADARFNMALSHDSKALAFARQLADCDILHLHGEAYLWANFFKKPFVLHSYGYDLDQLPFKRDTAKSATLAFFARRGIKRAARIIIAPHQKIFLERLGVADRGAYLPFPIDTDKYRPLDASSLKRHILSSRHADFVFFHPARHEWLDKSATSNKGNDKVINAFAGYQKRSAGKGVLILVDKGRDVGESKRLIGELGLKDRILWLEAMPKGRIIEYYNASDIVLDQFNLGSFGQIFLESMACGRPTFIYLKGYDGLYSSHPPAINVKDADEIASKLVEFTSDAALMKRSSEASREWILKHHDKAAVTSRYIQMYRTMLESVPKVPARRLRILHAPAIVINQQWIISRAQRRLGHTSDFMAFNADREELPVRDCDINLHFDRKDISFRSSRLISTMKFLINFFIFFLSALFKYDIFHFHSESFFGSNSSLDLKILRFLRKKIVFQYWGCDIRLKTPSILSGDFSTCDDCIRVCQNSRKYRDNLMHLQYADFRVYGGTDVIRMVPDAIFIPIAIDLDSWKPADEIPEAYRFQETDSVRVLQAFENASSRGDQKGTRFIKKAVEELKAQGHKIEYVFIDRVPYDAMKYYYQQADIVVDQLLTGWHGSITAEAMAMSKPVICYLNEDALKFLPKDHPIVNATPDTITKELKKLLDDKELREELGKRSRRYVEDRHDAMKLAGIYADLYDKEYR